MIVCVVSDLCFVYNSVSSEAIVVIGGSSFMLFVVESVNFAVWSGCSQLLWS